MDDQIKIYDTVRGNQSFIYYNSVPNGYNTTNSAKLKKSNHWTNIFTWKKKAKQSPNSILNYPFMANTVPVMTTQKYSSVSAATGIAYAFAPPPGRLPPSINTYSPQDLRQDFITATTTTTTTIHASIKGNSPNKQHRNSLFYSPWESFHDQSVNHLTDECTCEANPIVDTYCSPKEQQKSLRGLSSKCVPMIAPAIEPIYESRRLSRMDLYSLEEESVCQKGMEFKSKSSDSLFKPKKELPLNGVKSSRSSTTLNANPFEYKANKAKNTTSATVNERFLRFFKKSSTDPYNSIASRKSILECEVSAYDLIKRKLKTELIDEFEDDIDDSLSDNAIENENNVGTDQKALKLNRKSTQSLLLESNSSVQSGSGSEAKHPVAANSVRIGGIGMHFALPAPKLVNNNNSSKIYSNLDSGSESTPSTSTWSESSGLSSDESILVPEPDYDIDDNVYNDSQTYSSSETGNNSTNFQHLKLSYSPPLPTKRMTNQNNSDSKQNDCIYNKFIAKQSSNINKCSKETNYPNEDNNRYVSRVVGLGLGSHSNGNESKGSYNIYKGLPQQRPSTNSTEPPCLPPCPPPHPPPYPPPPLPPCLPELPAPYRQLVIPNKSALKSSSMTPKGISYQCELKDKLNSGVKSILKKTQIINNNLSIKEKSLSKSENDIRCQNASSESCDYLKTFKEFKESRLRNGRQQRKRVQFKSQSDDRLIVDQINGTILEVDESDEPIYDDVQLPGLSTGDIDTGITGQPSLNGSSLSDECHKSDQLNMSSESTLSDNRIAKSITNSNCSDNRRMGTNGTVEFSEFDPSEHKSSSTSPAPAQAAEGWMKRIDLKPKHNNSLTECQNNFNNNSNKESDNEVNQEIRGPKGPLKKLMPFPSASVVADSFSTGAQQKISSNFANQLKVPIVERKYLPQVMTQTSNRANSTAPAEQSMSDRHEGKPTPIPIPTPTTNRTTAPQPQARATKSLTNSSSLTDNSYLSPKERLFPTIVPKNTEKQTLVPVSQEKCASVQNNNNILFKTNFIEIEKKANISDNTETEISKNTNRFKTLTVNAPPIQTNSFGSNFYDGIRASKSLQSIDELTQNTSINPYLCTISIKNGTNNRIVNQTHIATNVCLTTNQMPFEPIGSFHSSSSLYDPGTQSSTDSLNTEKCQILDQIRSLSESPITVICANSNDKIVINVPLDNTFDSINDHIYEELDTYVDTDDSNLENCKSIFDGASKDEILEFLEDAKERVREDILVDTSIDPNIEILEAIDVIEDMEENPILSTKNLIESTVSSNRRNRTSNVSNSSTDSTATTSSSIDIEDDIIKCAITNSVSVGQLVERNDSGVGAETSKPSRLRKLSLNDEVEHQCTDCEQHVDPNEDEVTGLLHYPLFCHRCDKKRSERKEIISEIVDTEFKYGRDLRIIREEFYRPIEIAGLLSKEQLRGVFLNLDELIGVNSKFSEKLQDAIDIATEQGDEDFTTVNIGKLFRDSSSMLHAFEAYCVRQGSAALLLNHLEKEKELLRIFLRVSQMENTLLRRMNLRSFLVVPVQRVTKYPLLLNRLYKVTPYHHRDREALRESQQKVELHLEHINQQTKGTIGATTRIWRRISNLSTSHRRLNNVDDIGNIKIRKAALETLKWNQEETQFVVIGKVFFTTITDYTVNRKAKTLKFLTASALLVTLGRPNQNYRPDLVNITDAEKDMVFPRDNTGITDAVLLLIKEKCGRYALQKEILNLKSCVISSETESDDMFEIHEQTTKESILFKAETLTETKDWLKQLKYHSKDLGNWRRRRHALANIMMVRQ